jgi:hypothetical protein
MVIVKRESNGKNNHDTVAGRIDEQGMQLIDSLYAYNDIINNPKDGYVLKPLLLASYD